MIHVHRLDGCAPAPLAHYLKALGVLRLVAEQADNEVRGWWKGNRFQLATQLDRKALEAFFLRDYQPTPIFNPWGARSGFYDGRPETNARNSLDKIERSRIPQLDPFRLAIRTVRSVITNNKPSDKEKDRLIQALRLKTRGSSSLWLDAVVALTGTGDDMSLEQPPIFGTGGNEGSGGYPSAYMSAVVEAVISDKWDHAVTSSLFGESTAHSQWKQSMGQFAPAGNTTPWDMLLAFEGACVLRSSVSGRGKTSTVNKKWMSSPFYVAPRGAGYASGSRLDEKFLNKGREYPGRGEQWFPIWEKPARFSEIQQIFSQGRAVARSRHSVKVSDATDGWTMARAVADFGVSRGITEFLRYGYQQRNNQATHFAIPLGRFRVVDTEPVASSCLADLDQWLSSLHRGAHPADDQKIRRVPARLTIAYHRLMDALFSVISDHATHRQWQDVLLCLGEVEAVMRHGSGFSAQPIPRLRPEWVRVCNDETPEFRLAVAFSLQCGRRVEDHVRRHWLPLERKRPQLPLDPERRQHFAVNGTRLDVQPEVVMHGRHGIDDAVALVERRLVEASQRESRHLPLKAAPRAAAAVTDLTGLVSGEVDLDRTLTLARALMALDRRAWAERYTPMESPRTLDWPDDAWLAIRLCALPWPLKTRSGFELDIGTDPAIIRRLVTGDAASAVAIALRRLGAADVRCTVRAGTASPATARLWAAALAFPIAKKTAEQFLYRLDPSKE